MLERGWFYFSLRDDIPKLASNLRNLLRDADVDGALRSLQASPSAEGCGRGRRLARSRPRHEGR